MNTLTSRNGETVQSMVVDCTLPKLPLGTLMQTLLQLCKLLLSSRETGNKQIRCYRRSESWLASSASAKEKLGGVTFFYCGGLIYRRWSPKKRDALLGSASTATTMLAASLTISQQLYKQDERKNPQVPLLAWYLQVGCRLL